MGIEGCTIFFPDAAWARFLLWFSGSDIRCGCMMLLGFLCGFIPFFTFLPLVLGARSGDSHISILMYASHSFDQLTRKFYDGLSYLLSLLGRICPDLRVLFASC
jgi:hypothetical protein